MIVRGNWGQLRAIGEIRKKGSRGLKKAKDG